MADLQLREHVQLTTSIPVSHRRIDADCSEACFVVSKDVGPEDARIAFENAAELPALRLRQDKTATLSFVVPESQAWQRIRRNWGDPSYEVALVSSQRQLQYCADGIIVSAKQNGVPLALERADWLYGFGSDDSSSRDCKSVGSKFQATPGSVIQVNLNAIANFGDGTMLVVRPVWPYTKDKLVGVDLDVEFAPVVKGLAVLGLLIAAGAALALRNEKRKPRLS